MKKLIAISVLAMTLMVGGLALGQSKFSDTDGVPWAHEAIDWAVSNEITGGTGPNTFSPYDTLNRAQAVTFLYRASNVQDRHPDCGSRSKMQKRLSDTLAKDTILWNHNGAGRTSRATLQMSLHAEFRSWVLIECGY